MTDVLEDKTDLWEADLGPQQVIMVIFEFFISKVIPSVHRDRNINLTRNENTYVLASPYRSACALVTCLPFLHLLHLNVS